MRAKKLSRREFLIAATVTAGGSILAACAKPATEEPTPKPAEPTPKPGEPTVKPAEPTLKPAVEPTQSVTSELEPPPELPFFEGGPQWDPPDLTGQHMELWGWNSAMHVERHKMLIETFQKRTGAVVEFQEQAFPLDTKVIAAIASGTAPDVIYWMGVRSSPIIREKGIIPIDELVFEPLGIDVEKWWRPGAIGAFFRDGKYWGTPTEDNWDGYSVSGRLDLIEQASPDAKELWPGSKGEEGVYFESYEDLWTLAEELQQTDDAGNVTIWGLNSSGWDIHSVTTIMRGLGTFWWDEENQKFNMDSEAAVEALRILVEIPIERGIETLLGMRQVNAFTAGEVALARGNATAPGHGWNEVDPPIQGENVIAPPPIPGTTFLSTGEGGWGFEIPSQIQNQDVAVEYLKFTSTYEAQYIWAGIYGGSPPAIWALADCDIYQGDHPIQVGLRRVLKALENSVFFGWGYGDHTACNDAFTETLNTLREGKLDAQEAAQMIQDRCTSQLETWLAEA